MNTKEKKHLDMVTILRIIAFVCIFLLHEKIFAPVDWRDGMRFPWLVFTPAWGGTWIFFLLSGYGLGFGFASKKYDLSPDGIKKFYRKRLAAIVPIYWFYIFSVSFVVTPEIWHFSRLNMVQLFRLFFFCYQEQFYSKQFGLAWYMTTLVRLYLISPFIFIALTKVLSFSRRISAKKVISLIVTLGLVMRLIALFSVVIYGGDWSANVYKPFYFNLDLFSAGMALHFVRIPEEMSHKKIKSNRVLVFISLIGFILVNSYVYYQGDVGGNSLLRYIYISVFPSIYIVLCSLYLFYFDRVPLGLSNIWRKLSFLNDFRRIQYPMYLFHSTVFLGMKHFFNVEVAESILHFFHFNDSGAAVNTMFTLVCFIITIAWAIIVAVAFKPRNSFFFSKRKWNIDLDKLLFKQETDSHIKSRGSYVLVAFFTQIVALIVLLAVNAIMYATNDDTTVASLIGGKIGGYTIYAINLHIILGALLSQLAKVVSINVLTVYFIIVICLSFLCIDITMLTNAVAKSKVAIIIIVLDIWFLLVLHHFTFTVVAFASASAALLLMNSYLFDNNIVERKHIILALILYIQALLIRPECLYALVIIEIFYAINFCFKNHGKLSTKECIKTILLVSAVVLSVLISVKSNFILEGVNKEQGAFREWGEKRSEALDCAQVPYSDKLEKKGMSKNEWSAIYNAFYYDRDVVDTDNMNILIEENSITNKYSFNVLGFVTAYFSYLSNFPSVVTVHRWLFFFVFVLALIELCIKQNNSKLRMLFCIWVGIIAVNALYFVIQRAVYRVEMPVFLFGCMLMAQLTFSDSQGMRQLTVLSKVALGVILFTLCGFVVSGFINTKSEHNKNMKVLEYLDANDDKLFLAGDPTAFVIPCSESIWEYPGRNGQWNLIGNWEIYSVPYINLVSSYGIRDANNTLLESIGSSSILYLTSMGDDFSISCDYINEMVVERYGKHVHFVKETTIDDVWSSYRLVEDN